MDLPLCALLLDGDNHRRWVYNLHIGIAEEAWERGLEAWSDRGYEPFADHLICGSLSLWW